MTDKTVDEARAIAHRFTFLKNASLDGFSDGIDYDRLTAGTDWALRGLQGREPTEALIGLFEAPWQAAKDEGEFDGDCRAEALKEIVRISAEADALSAPRDAGDREAVARTLAVRKGHSDLEAMIWLNDAQEDRPVWQMYLGDADAVLAALSSSKTGE